MYGIYAKCIFPIMNKFFYKDVVFKINVKEKGKVNDNTAKMQSTNQLGV